MFAHKLIVQRIRPIFKRAWNQVQKDAQTEVDSKEREAFMAGVKFGFWRGAQAGINLNLDEILSDPKMILH